MEWDKDQGSYIVLRPNGVTEIGLVRGDGSAAQAEWRIDRQLTVNARGHFRMLLRDSFLEFYLEDVLIQVYGLPKRATGRIGVINGAQQVSVGDMSAWEMSL